jgi:orotate phosphoribosyltransferase
MKTEDDMDDVTVRPSGPSPAAACKVMGLFRFGSFVAASGSELPFKIDCDALTKTDWECIALASLSFVGAFNTVYGVPRGGLALAEAFMPFQTSASEAVLIVDDVWTTGGSIRKFAESASIRHYKGFVAFSRAPRLPPNVGAFCTLTAPARL